MATILSDESMAKRGSTKELLALEEDADTSSRIKKQKVDEEEDEDSSGSSDIDMDFGTDSEWIQYRYVSKEPEWGYDSFDDREFKINPRIRSFYPNQQLYDIYYNNRLKAFESKGFLPDPSVGIYELNIERKKGERDLIADLADVCVKKFNKTKNKTLELVNVVRVNRSGQARWKLYITFMAREYRGGPLVEYQAKVLHFIMEPEVPPFPILCRPSPKPQL